MRTAQQRDVNCAPGQNCSHNSETGVRHGDERTVNNENRAKVKRIKKRHFPITRRAKEGSLRKMECEADYL